MHKKLKVKMATFLISRRQKELKSLLGEDFTPKTKKQVKRFLNKFSYKEMEVQIIQIMEKKESNELISKPEEFPSIN